MDLSLTNTLIMAAATIAAAVIGLIPYLLRRRSHRDRTKEPDSGEPLLTARGSTVAAEPSSSASVIEISFEEYVRRLRGFGDRFLEKEEFQQAIVRKQVDWTGYVVGVHSGAFGNISVHFSPSPETEGLGFVAAAIFGGEWKTKLFSMRMGDRVRIRGVAHGGVSPFMIDGEAIDLIAGDRQ